MTSPAGELSTLVFDKSKLEKVIHDVMSAISQLKAKASAELQRWIQALRDALGDLPKVTVAISAWVQAGAAAADALGKLNNEVRSSTSYWEGPGARDFTTWRMTSAMAVDSWRKTFGGGEAGAGVFVNGLTNAGNAVVKFYNDLFTAFVKLATDRETAKWLKDERRIYERVHEEFMPALSCRASSAITRHL